MAGLNGAVRPAAVSSSQNLTPRYHGQGVEKAVAIDRKRRYSLLSEFVHDLAQPNPAFQSSNAEPLIERNPLLV